MSDTRNSSPSLTPADGAAPADPRPAYEPPRLARKRAVREVTLFSGGSGPPATAPPLVAQG